MTSTPSTSTPSELIDARELGQRLGMQRPTVLKMARRGQIPCLRLSAKVIRFAYADVLTALRSPRPDNVRPVRQAQTAAA